MSTFYSILSGVYLLSFDRYIDLTIPLWVFWAFPPYWLVIIPITAILCSIVMYVALEKLKIKNYFRIFRKTIIKTTFFGFLCDYIVVVLIYTLESRLNYINPKSDFYIWYKNIFLRALERNPFSNVFALTVLCSIILLSRIINYKLNKKYTFSKLDIDEENKKKLALAIAIFTAPYTFFFTITI